LLFHETQAECPRVRLRVGRIATACVLVAAFVTASGMPAGAQPGSISLDPTHGPVRATVTIIGTGLSATSAVSFAGADAVFTVEDEEHVSATVPPGAATGPVQVDTTDGSVTSDPFVVQPNIVVILTDDHPGRSGGDRRRSTRPARVARCGRRPGRFYPPGAG